MSNVSKFDQLDSFLKDNTKPTNFELKRKYGAYTVEVKHGDVILNCKINDLIRHMETAVADSSIPLKDRKEHFRQIQTLIDKRKSSFAHTLQSALPNLIFNRRGKMASIKVHLEGEFIVSKGIKYLLLLEQLETVSVPGKIQALDRHLKNFEVKDKSLRTQVKEVRRQMKELNALPQHLQIVAYRLLTETVTPHKKGDYYYLEIKTAGGREEIYPSSFGRLAEVSQAYLRECETIKAHRDQIGPSIGKVLDTVLEKNRVMFDSVLKITKLADDIKYQYTPGNPKEGTLAQVQSFIEQSPEMNKDNEFLKRYTLALAAHTAQRVLRERNDAVMGWKDLNISQEEIKAERDCLKQWTQLLVTDQNAEGYFDFFIAALEGGEALQVQIEEIEGKLKNSTYNETEKAIKFCILLQVDEELRKHPKKEDLERLQEGSKQANQAMKALEAIYTGFYDLKSSKDPSVITTTEEKIKTFKKTFPENTKMSQELDQWYRKESKEMKKDRVL